MAPAVPVFLLSMPRTGSTLVQRVLASHDEIATTAEPWLLTHLFGALHRDWALGESQSNLSTQLLGFGAQLPGGVLELEHELADTARRLYTSAAGEAHYFLDKSPSYALLAADIVRLFPEAKLVFLWRNPVAMVASIASALGPTWGSVHVWEGGLFAGLPHIIKVYADNRERAVAARYEDLVMGDEAAWSRIMDHLELPFDPASLQRFSEVELSHRLRPSDEYETLTTEPLRKWRDVVDNPLRKAWMRRYLRWLGAERLAVMGYDLDVLLGELDAAPMRTRRVASDTLSMVYPLARMALARLPFGARVRRWLVRLSRP